ncbi:DNA methylase [Bacteroidales bacterium Barb4]|nr:DNA methylase [Bacteroidales bacterium Barb4]
MDLFSQPTSTSTQNTITPKAILIEKPATLQIEPRPYSGGLETFRKESSLVIKGQVGFFERTLSGRCRFIPLELHPLQTQKTEQYIQFRGIYHLLYNYEARERKENKELRSSLNDLCNTFVKRYGNLNSRKNNGIAN